MYTFCRNIIRSKYHIDSIKIYFHFCQSFLSFLSQKIFFFQQFPLKRGTAIQPYIPKNLSDLLKGCVCCSKGSRILNVNALFYVIALVYKEKLFPFFILWNCLFSIHNFRCMLFLFRFFFILLHPKTLYISIYIRFQFHFIRSPILMDSLSMVDCMKLDLLTFHSQPQLNRMVLFFFSSSDPFGNICFRYKTKKISNEEKVLMLSVV